MTPRPRLVFDTNVVVSAALFPDSVPRRAIVHALRLGAILMADELAEEIRNVLIRARFDRYATQDVREEFVRDLMLDVELVTVTEPVQACRDPDDDKILELAVNGGADYIVTGDDDLLVLNPFHGIAIVTPSEFLTIPHARNR